LPFHCVNREWYNLEINCLVKEINANTLYANPKYQPDYGQFDVIVCGRKQWNKETIRIWY